MAGLKDAKTEILADPEALARRVAAWIAGLAGEAEGAFRICLSGGSTPKHVYELLAGEEHFPWERAEWYFGDERYVPADDGKSNYRMAELALFTRAPIPRQNVHRVLTESETPEIAAQRYESALQRANGGQRLDPAKPLFDVMLLGLGEDGHTASLFPGNKALAEKDRWVVSVPDGTPPTRISLTFPVLNSSRHAAFLVAGEGKRNPLERVLKQDASAPASHIAPVGTLHLFADEAARVPGLNA